MCFVLLDSPPLDRSVAGMLMCSRNISFAKLWQSSALFCIPKGPETSVTWSISLSLHAAGILQSVDQKHLLAHKRNFLLIESTPSVLNVAQVLLPIPSSKCSKSNQEAKVFFLKCFCHNSSATVCRNFWRKHRKERDNRSPPKKLQFYLHWNIQSTRLIWSRRKWQNFLVII